MHPLSDKDLDRLSREAAEQYDVEQNTSGWEKLEQGLHKHMPEIGKKERRRFLFFIWLIALLSGGGLLWLLTGNNAPDRVASNESSTGTALSSPTNSGTGESTLLDKTDKMKRDQTGQSTGTSLPPDNKVKEKRNSALLEEDVLKDKADLLSTKSKKLQPNLHQDKAIDISKETSSNNRQNSKKNKNNPAAPGLSIVTGDQKESNTAAKNVIDSDKAIPASSSSLTTPQSPIDNKKIDNKIASSGDNTKQSITGEPNPDSVSPKSTNKTQASKNKEGFKKGLEIGAVGSPDMSNVKFGNSDKVGINYGLQLGYRLSQRWSINTGVTYTRKNYNTPGKDFNAPKGSWLDNVNLGKVEGDCFMFDIPLNVRYDLNANGNHRYFLGAGLSTYLMKEENYHYYYQYTNGSPGYRYRSTPSTEQHWLSVLNLSAGFEKKLNRKFSVQAEPYLKIPLQGIGYGNIQLNSYGVYLSLKYHAKKH